MKHGKRDTCPLQERTKCNFSFQYEEDTFTTDSLLLYAFILIQMNLHTLKLKDIS